MEASKGLREAASWWSAGERSDCCDLEQTPVGQCPLPAAWDQVGCVQTKPRWSPPQPLPERWGNAWLGKPRSDARKAQ